MVVTLDFKTRLTLWLLHFAGFVLVVKATPYFERLLLKVGFIQQFASPDSFVLNILGLVVAYLLYQAVVPKIVLGIIEMSYN